MIEGLCRFSRLSPSIERAHDITTRSRCRRRWLMFYLETFPGELSGEPPSLLTASANNDTI